MTQYYGITPMDVERMSWREVSEYVHQMNKAREEDARGQ